MSDCTRDDGGHVWHSSDAGDGRRGSRPARGLQRGAAEAYAAIKAADDGAAASLPGTG